MVSEVAPRGGGTYSGERFDPTRANALAHYDHYARYHFTRQVVAGRGSLLDVGCGLGVSTAFLAEVTTSTLGIDADAGAVAEAQRERGSDRLSFATVAELEQTPGRRFDVVSCLEVIEHTTQQDELVSLVHRHLAPGGLAVLSTPNIAYTQAHGIHNEFHVRELTRADFAAVLGRHFKHVELWTQAQLNGCLITRGVAGEGSTRFVAEAPGRAVIPADAELATNYVALCSDVELPKFEPLAYVDPISTYAQQLQEIISKEAKMIEERVELLGRQEVTLREQSRQLLEASAGLRRLKIAPETPPLRHVVVDQINERFKQLPLHGAAKRFAQMFLKR